MNTVVTAELPVLLECTHCHARLVMPKAGLRADVLTLAILRFTTRAERWDGTPQPRLYDDRGAGHPHLAPVTARQGDHQRTVAP